MFIYCLTLIAALELASSEVQLVAIYEQKGWGLDFEDLEEILLYQQ